MSRAYNGGRLQHRLVRERIDDADLELIAL